MAEIILFRPAANKLTSHRCPLGLVYIATPLVNKGFTVKIIDEEICRDWLTELKNTVDSSSICAGISVMTGRSIKSALDFSKELRKIKQIPIIFGGIHPTFLPHQTLKNDFVDIVVMGEGEKVFLELVGHIKNGEDLSNVKGIMYKQNGKIYNNKEEDFLDLDTLSTPIYDLIDIEYYYNPKRSFAQEGMVFDLNVDRGCPNRCAFCYNIKFNKRRWRAAKSEKVLDIIEAIIDKYGAKAINFVSDNFFVDKNRIFEICKGMIDRNFNIRWHADIRIDSFLSYDNELIGLIKDSGCAELTFGVESGSDRVLKMIDKDIKVEDVLKAHKRAREFNFNINYHFMVGFPEETKADIAQTIKLILFLTRNNNAVIYGPSIFTPYPGTPLYDRCLELGFVPADRLEDWANYNWSGTSKIPWFSKSYKSYIKEVSVVCGFLSTRRGSGKKINDNAAAICFNIFNGYCRQRAVGLIYGVRLFALDINVMRTLRNILRLIVKVRGVLKNTEKKGKGVNCKR